MEYEVRKTDLLYPDLSFQIVGVLYDVYNALGAGHHEKYYHRGLVAGFKSKNIKYINEYPAEMKVYNEAVGKYFFDFLIEDKIILEIKRGKWFKKRDVEQVNRYLESSKYKLAILAIFKPDEVKYLRLVNWKKINNNSN